MWDVSTDGLTLSSTHRVSDHMDHRAGKRVVAREKERKRMHACTCVRACACVCSGDYFRIEPHQI